MIIIAVIITDTSFNIWSFNSVSGKEEKGHLFIYLSSFSFESNCLNHKTAEYINMFLSKLLGMRSFRRILQAFLFLCSSNLPFDGTSCWLSAVRCTYRHI